MSPGRRWLTAAAAVTLLAAFGPQGDGQSDGVTITFLANEGVMLSSGTRKVLIDALFLKYERGYATPAESTQASLEAARAPFDSVDVVLVTHRHGDHFHPAPVTAHLQANPRATLLASQQVLDSLRGRVPAGSALASRVLARTTAPNVRRREVVNGVPVEVLGLVHHDLEHLGYIVDIGGRRVLHVGDTDDGSASFPAFRLDTARIDVALLPYWMVMSAEGRRMVDRWIRPKHVVAFHVGVSEGARAARDVARAFPEAVVFSRSLESRRF
jgi:L-ascorbate metabolism protein UlaG (beta-lactamase superfamily)